MSFQTYFAYSINQDAHRLYKINELSTIFYVFFMQHRMVTITTYNDKVHYN